MQIVPIDLIASDMGEGEDGSKKQQFNKRYYVIELPIIWSNKHTFFIETLVTFSVFPL